MGIRKTLLIASTALVVPLAAAQGAPLGSMAAQSQVASTLNETADNSVLLHRADWWNEGNEDVKDWWNGEGGEEEGGEEEGGERWDERGERGNWWNESDESGRHNWWNESGEAGERGKKHKHKWSKKWNENGEGGERWDEGGKGRHSWWHEGGEGEEGGERWD